MEDEKALVNIKTSKEVFNQVSKTSIIYKALEEIEERKDVQEKQIGSFPFEKTSKRMTCEKEPAIEPAMSPQIPSPKNARPISTAKVKTDDKIRTKAKCLKPKVLRKMEICMLATPYKGMPKEATISSVSYPSAPMSEAKGALAKTMTITSKMENTKVERSEVPAAFLNSSLSENSCCKRYFAKPPSVKF